MTTEELIRRVQGRGLSLVWDQKTGRPAVRGDQRLITPAMLRALKWHREAIIANLKPEGQVPCPEPSPSPSPSPAPAAQPIQPDPVAVGQVLCRTCNMTTSAALMFGSSCGCCVNRWSTEDDLWHQHTAEVIYGMAFRLMERHGFGPDAIMDQAWDNGNMATLRERLRELQDKFPA